MPTHLQAEGTLVEGTKPMQFVYDKDTNKIGDKGCKWLSQGRWPLFQTFDLGYCPIKKGEIKYQTKEQGTSAKQCGGI